MAVSNGSPVNARALLDQNYIATVNIPNGANVVNTSGLDLIQATAYPTTDRVDVQILMTAGASANNKNVNVCIQDSADNSNWTNAVYFAAPLFQVVDNNGAGTNTANAIIKLQPGGQRYIRVQLRGEANGGLGTNGVGTLQLLF